MKRRSYGTKGAALIEFAVVSTLLLFILMGVAHFGHMMMVSQTVTRAAREGARIAAVKGTSYSQVQSRVNDTMSSAGLDDFSLSTNLDSLDSEDTEVWVEISISSNHVLLGGFLGGDESPIQSRVTMYREGASAS